MSVTIKNPEEITILATGGTIDKFYSVAGTMDIGEPAAKDLLDRVITDVRFDIRPLIGKDSLDMTDEDRAELPRPWTPSPTPRCSSPTAPIPCPKPPATCSSTRSWVRRSWC